MSLILDLLFPRLCLGCNKKGEYICGSCLKSQQILIPKFTTDKIHEGTVNIFKYHSVIRKAIVELKYKFVTDLADNLADICSCAVKNNFPHILEYWQKNNFVLIPIPLFISRFNWRGFNQSLLLASKISSNLNLKFLPDVLTRSVFTKPQVKLKKKSARYKNIQNAFSLSVKPQLIPKNIILFDDVYTTGSTLNSAFNAFKTCGLDHCWFLTIAR
jgi:ComF family protein